MKKIVFVLFFLILLIGLIYFLTPIKDVVSSYLESIKIASNIGKNEEIDETKEAPFENEIYLVKNSLVTKDDKTFAQFKQDLSGTKIDNKPVSYRILEYEASCDDSLALSNTQTLYYDKDNNLIKRQVNHDTGYRSLCANVKGEFYYSQMCKEGHKCNVTYPEARTLNKEDTITMWEYFDINTRLMQAQPVSLNEYGEAVYNDKVILTGDRLPMNSSTFYTLTEMKFFFVAEGAKPKEGCDPDDGNNGFLGLGCYMTNPDEITPENETNEENN